MIALFLCLVITAGLLQALILRHGLDKVSYTLDISERFVECDQKFDVTAVIENRKLLPVLFLRLDEYYPKPIDIDTDNSPISVSESNALMPDSVKLSQTMYLLSNQRIRRTLSVSFPNRGVKTFRDAVLTGGDLFGTREDSKTAPLRHTVIVLPKRLDAPELEDTFGNFLGDMSVRRYILEDPVLTLSFREYTGREPMKDISWPRSLRDGKLMVKQYDYTMELSATVILNVAPVSGDPEDEEQNLAALERALSLARGVCEYLEHKKVSYNFQTNAIAAGISGAWASGGDGLGRGHLMSILQGLGAATAFASKPFSRLMEDAINRAESGRAHILITTGMDGERASLVRQAEGRIGSKIFLIDAYQEVS